MERNAAARTSVGNRTFRLRRADFRDSAPVLDRIEAALGGHVLRWFISHMDAETIAVDATLVEERAGPFRSFEGILRQPHTGRAVVASIIPTGIGCEIGGYAGDAGPASALLAQCCDHLVTNPNALNASNFINLPSNLLYAEGSTLDAYCQGRADLHVPYANRVGLVIEVADEATLAVVYNLVNAVRAIHGVDILDPVVTTRPIGARFEQSESGAILGALDDPGPLYAACEQLISRGATAIAITSIVRDIPPELYVAHFDGRAANPVGGAEAVISHLVTRRFGLPAAHAPLLNRRTLELVDEVVDPRGAGEAASESGLACVLIGLQRAAHIEPLQSMATRAIVASRDLMAVVAPATALGGVPVIAAQDHGIPVIAVSENATLVQVGEAFRPDGIIPARNYAEAAGLIMALRAGIAPSSLVRPLRRYDIAKIGLSELAAAC